MKWIQRWIRTSRTEAWATTRWDSCVLWALKLFKIILDFTEGLVFDRPGCLDECQLASCHAQFSQNTRSWYNELPVELPLWWLLSLSRLVCRFHDWYCQCGDWYCRCGELYCRCGDWYCRFGELYCKCDDWYCRRGDWFFILATGVFILATGVIVEATGIVVEATGIVIVSTCIVTVTTGIVVVATEIVLVLRRMVRQLWRLVLSLWLSYRVHCVLVCSFFPGILSFII